MLAKFNKISPLLRKPAVETDKIEMEKGPSTIFTMKQKIPFLKIKIFGPVRLKLNYLERNRSVLVNNDNVFLSIPLLSHKSY